MTSEMLVQDSKATRWMADLVHAALNYFDETIRPKVAGLAKVTPEKVRFIWGFPTQKATTAAEAKTYQVIRPTKDVKIARVAGKADVYVADPKAKDKRTVHVAETWVGVLSPLKYSANFRRFGKFADSDALNTADVLKNVLRVLILIGNGDGVETLQGRSPLVKALADAGWTFPVRRTHLGTPIVDADGVERLDYANFEPPKAAEVALAQIAEKIGPLPTQMALDMLTLKRQQIPNALIKMSLIIAGQTFDVRLTGKTAREINSKFGKRDIIDAQVKRLEVENMTDAEKDALASADKGRGGKRHGAGRKRTHKAPPQAEAQAEAETPRQ